MSVAPWLTEVEYPESDGQPMAETDFQRVYLVYATEVLETYFQSQPNTYVSGNLCLYYEEGNPQNYVAPDVFVVLGISKHKRRTYKVWEEGKAPDFVLEITSKSTVSTDQGTKKGLYAFLGVQEYFQYDPTGDYLEPPLKGLRLVDEVYQPIPPHGTNDNLAIRSDVLALDLCLDDGELRFYNPVTGEKLLSYQESESARKQAEARASLETERADRLAAKLRELGIDPTEL